MSVGNYGAVMNLLQGQLGIDIDSTNVGGTTLGARSSQGVAIVGSLLHQILARPDFANTLNAKISGPILNSTATLNYATTAVNPVALIYDNSSATDIYYVTFGVVLGSVTLGTTNPSTVIYAKATTQGSVVFPQPMVNLTNTGWSWDATTNIYAGATRSTVSTLTTLAVFTA